MLAALMADEDRETIRALAPDSALLRGQEVTRTRGQSFLSNMGNRSVAARYVQYNGRFSPYSTLSTQYTQ